MADDLKVKVDIVGEDNLSPAANSASSSLDKLGGSAKNTHAASDALALGLAGGVVSAATAVAGGLVYATDKAAEFEKSISATAAVTGASSAEMGQLSSLALQLGKDTSFSAKEAADGLGELAKGGVSVADIMGGAAASALNLAAAGGVSVADAAALAANAMSLFGIEGDKTAGVVDKIAGFANATTGSVSDFKFALSSAGAVAKLTGQTFDDTAVAISLMGQAGVLGSDAGTSLKTMLENLQPKTKAQREEWVALGLTTKETANAFVSADGSFKSLRDVAEILHTSLAGLTEAQRAAALQTMFGTDAIRAGAIIAQAGADGWDEMAASMDKVSAADVAATRLDNLAGSTEQLNGSVETAAIILGEQLTPTVKEATDIATQFLNEVVIPFAEQNGPAFGAALRDGAHAGGDLLLALTPLWTVAGPALRTAVDATGEAIDGEIAFFYELVVAAVDLKNGVGDAFDTMGTTVHDDVDGVTTFALDRWTDLQTGVTSVQDAIGSKVTEVWDGIPVDIRTDLGKVGDAIATKTTGFMTDTLAWLTGTQTATDSSWSATSTTVTSKTDLIGTTIGTAFSDLGTKTRGWWDAVEGAISGPITVAYTNVTTFATNVGTSLSGLATTMLTEATAVGTAIVDGIKAGIGAGVQSVKDAAGNMARDALGAAKAALGVESPSKEFQVVGDMSVQGIIVGLLARKDELLGQADRIAEEVLAKFAPLRDPLGTGMVKEGGLGALAGQMASPVGQTKPGAFGDFVGQLGPSVVAAGPKTGDLTALIHSLGVEAEAASVKTGALAQFVDTLATDEDLAGQKTGALAGFVDTLGDDLDGAGGKAGSFGDFVAAMGNGAVLAGPKVGAFAAFVDGATTKVGVFADFVDGLGGTADTTAGKVGRFAGFVAGADAVIGQAVPKTGQFAGFVAGLGAEADIAGPKVGRFASYVDGLTASLGAVSAAAAAAPAAAVGGSPGQNNSYGGGAGGGQGTGLGSPGDKSSTFAPPPFGGFYPAWIGTAFGHYNGALTGFFAPPPPIPKFAGGVSDFVGGMAMVGEQGPELAWLPQHSSVYPHGTGPIGGGQLRLHPDDIAAIAQAMTQAGAQHPIVLDGAQLNQNNRTRNNYYAQSNLDRGVGALVSNR